MSTPSEMPNTQTIRDCLVETCASAAPAATPKLPRAAMTVAACEHEAEGRRDDAAPNRSRGGVFVYAPLERNLSRASAVPKWGAGSRQ
jgi:hypothetical protein